MSKKDFELIARVVKGISDSAIRHATAASFARELKVINPRFDSDRFCKACDSFIEF